MSQKRRDTKGRILATGESQRADGRYAYKYNDYSGKTKFIYAWKLVSTDSTPKGKRKDLSLREKEKAVQKDISDGIDTSSAKMTVSQLYKLHISLKTDVRYNTEQKCKMLLRRLEKESFGAKRIDDVKNSDVINWINHLKSDGLSYSTIRRFKGMLKGAFYTAINDNCIRKNPFDFNLKQYVTDNTVPRVALTEEQEEQFLTFIQNDKVYYKYYDEIQLLLKTGLRISEFCGLTTSDIDFENRFIKVNHQLMKEYGKYCIVPTKSKSGVRKVPISEETIKIFQRVIKNRVKQKQIVIDGYSDFVFISNSGFPKDWTNYDNLFPRIVKKYNSTHIEQLPNITPHVCRHTFCTRLANKGINLKALQKVMGHSKIDITLNVYTHATFDMVQSEMERLMA